MSARDQIFDTAQSRCTGVDELLIDKELNHAVEDFFIRSTAWRQSQKMQLKAGKDRYLVITPHPTVRVHSVIALGSAGSRYSNDLYFSDALTGGFLRAVFDPPNFIRLVNAPTEDTEVSFDTVLVPTNAEAIKEDTLLRFREGITDVLLSRLFMMAQKPWSSEKLAGFHGRLALNKISDAKRLAERAYGGPAWSFPPFA